MKEAELRFRQIHLDFHTSESIESIGLDFDPDEFAQTLLKANVNSITLFARATTGGSTSTPKPTRNAGTLT
jgi:hypothetical protein